MDSALHAFDNYPQLMLLHLMRNYRNMGFERVRMESEEDREAFRLRLRSSLKLRCLLMSAWHTAAPAIEVSWLRGYELVIEETLMGW